MRQHCSPLSRRPCFANSKRTKFENSNYTYDKHMINSVVHFTSFMPKSFQAPGLMPAVPHLDVRLENRALYFHSNILLETHAEEDNFFWHGRYGHAFWPKKFWSNAPPYQDTQIAPCVKALACHMRMAPHEETPHNTLNIVCPLQQPTAPQMAHCSQSSGSLELSCLK